jgi:integrase
MISANARQETEIDRTANRRGRHAEARKAQARGTTRFHSDDYAGPSGLSASSARTRALRMEPYCTMLYVALWTGLRVSELCALKWKCIHENSISIKQRYSRGEWAKTKTKASAKPIAVETEVIERIYRLKQLTVNVNAGDAVRTYKVVKRDGPEDLVFQSLTSADKPMNADNVRRRVFKPAADKLGVKLKLNWLSLRTSNGTWMVASGADVKAVQGQMRHARIATTLEIYAQHVPKAQAQAVSQMREYYERELQDASLVQFGPNTVQ